MVAKIWDEVKQRDHRRAIILSIVFITLLVILDSTLYYQKTALAVSNEQLQQQIQKLTKVRRLKDTIDCETVQGPDGCDYLIFENFGVVHSGVCTNPAHMVAQSAEHNAKKEEE